jgi:hypothetical protein
MATNYESQKGFYENVKLDENGYLLVTGISGGGGATGPAGTSGSSGSSGVNGSDGTSGVNGTDGTSGVNGTDGTSGTSPAGGESPIIKEGLKLISTSIGATTSASSFHSAGESITIGVNAVSNGGLLGVAIGATATVNGPYGIAIGYLAKADTIDQYQSNSIAIGKNARVRSQEGTGAIAIGMNAFVNNVYRGIAIGEGATDAAGNGSQVIGPLMTSASHNNVLLGNQNSSTGANVVCIGVVSQAAGNSVSIGPVTKANGESSVSIGNTSTVTATNAVGIGTETNVTHTNAVVLGTTMSSVVASHTHVRNLFISNPAVYADNTAALAGGLVAGQVYRTDSGVLMIAY